MRIRGTNIVLTKDKLFLLAIVFLSFSFSVGYSVLKSSLSLGGVIAARVKKDVRITALELTNPTNGAIENKSLYTVNTTTMNVTLPTNTSQITYRVTITNKTGEKLFVYGLSSEISNSNIEYQFPLLKEGDVLEGVTITFYVVIKNKTSTSQIGSVKLFYNISTLPDAYNVSYNNSISGSSATNVGEALDELRYNTFSSVKFEIDSWSTIKNNVQNNPSYYPVGVTKCVKVNGYTGSSSNGCGNGEFKVRVANNTTPSECSTPGFSQTACGFVVEFVDVITTYQMNTSDTNVGGWPATEMRTFVNGTIYNALPGDLKEIIVDTTVVSGHASTSGETNFTSTDKIYLLANHEIWSDKSSSDSAYESTRQLDYYANLGVVSTDSTKYKEAIKKNSSNSNAEWWLRSVHLGWDSTFFGVISNGSRRNNATVNSSKASYYSGVSPAFRIA